MWYVHKNSNRTLNTDVLERPATSLRHEVEVGCGAVTAHVVHEHISISLGIVCSPTKIFINGAK